MLRRVQHRHHSACQAAARPIWTLHDGSPPEEDTWAEAQLSCCSQANYSSLPSFLKSAKGFTYYSALTKVAPGAYKILLTRTQLQGTFFMCAHATPPPPSTK